MASPYPRCVSGPSIDLSAQYLGPLRILPTHLALLSLFPGTEVSSLCQNGGVCIDSGPSHFCHCPPGFQGSTCQDQVNPCESRPCQHGATCMAQPNGYLCQVRRSRGGGGETKLGWIWKTAVTGQKGWGESCPSVGQKESLGRRGMRGGLEMEMKGTGEVAQALSLKL